jgi:putative transcriptional regulator
MNTIYKSELSAAIHETAEMLHESGIIDDTDFSKFDSSCLVQTDDRSKEDDRRKQKQEKNED